METITITVDYNNDEVQLRIQEDKKEELYSFHCSNTHQVKSILEEVLNAICPMNKNQDIILEVVNEDLVKIVGNW